MFGYISRDAAAVFRHALAGAALAAAALVAPPTISTAHAAEADDAQHVRWSHSLEVTKPTEAPASPWFDMIAPTALYGEAREDLGDLRLFDAAGKEVPYALRVREAKYSQQELPAREFNRSVAADQASELTLDLGENPPEHNEIEVQLPGVDFRRRATLEASDNASEWHKLVEGNLFYFRTGDHELHELRLSHPPSRFRYLRLRVEKDPAIDRTPVEIAAVKVRYRVEIPGEYLAFSGSVWPRDAVRASGGPGSAWIVEFNADRVPCESIELEVSDQEFARDYVIEAGGRAGSDEPLRPIAWGQWSRKAGEPVRPLSATFPEQRCARLRIVVTDYSNPPLSVIGCQVRGAAREIIFARSADLSWPLRLYYGNPDAAPPHYDFERNLPAQLQPAPERIEPGAPQANPHYAPPPLPWSERWSWLIHGVLGLACLALGAILFSLGRTAIARDDARDAAEHAAAV